jgi:hypothetical protein
MTNAEGLFLAFLHLGAFAIDEEGRVWRRWWYATERRTRVPVHPPKRAEEPNTAGYLVVPFQWAGTLHHVMAHRVVYMHTSRTLLAPEREINHRNGVKTDNRPMNLQPCTPSENIRHAVRDLGRRLGARGARHHCAKLTWESVQEIRQAVEAGSATQVELCRRFGVSPAAMSQVVHGRTWKHVE